MFHVGQLVVCVLPPSHRDDVAYSGPLPSHNNVYVIRGIVTDPSDGELMLYLEEFFLPVHPVLRMEYGFWTNCFRPVTKRNEEIIASLLVPVKDGVDA